MCHKWSKLVAGANVTMYVGATFVQLFKLLSAEGARQLASRSGGKINTILPLKKKGLYDPVPVAVVKQ